MLMILLGWATGKESVPEEKTRGPMMQADFQLAVGDCALKMR